jgi:predicted ATPase/DNA-binding CsgD family transcriptional regulator
MEGVAAGPPAAGIQGFPVALTSFVGRAGALREAGDLLAEYRLVTVTGPGGVGKTRLASEVARQVADRFADGARLVELAPVPDPAQVPAAMAAALGVRPPPGVSATEALTRVLARRQLLVVLDNCEHVISAAAALCGELLRACDDLRILATSREALRIAGEAMYRLTPLPVPDLVGGAADAAGGAGDMAGVEAVALFADRARAADAGFALTGANRGDVARLVGRLDGMPLAIELAAARVAALGLAPLLGELDDRLALLAGGDRLAAGRHRSLAAAAEWSYRLLDEEEQRVFRWLSVFPAPFTLEAAEAVAGQDTAPAVLHLVECSLLMPPQPGPDGRLRYSMQQVLRSYGLGQLAGTGEQASAEAALARHALRIVEEAAAGLWTINGEAAAAQWLDAEDAITAAVLTWAAEHDLDTALRLAAALGMWWHLRGRLVSKLGLLSALADRAEPGSSGWRGLQWWIALSMGRLGDPNRLMEHCAETMAVIGDQEPSRTLADCLSSQAFALINLGRTAEAREFSRRSQVMSRELGYPLGEFLALTDLLIAAIDDGDPESALRFAHQVEQVQGVPAFAVRERNVLMFALLMEAGDLTAAERMGAATLASARAVGDLSTITSLLTHLVRLETRLGHPADAAVYLREATHLMLRTDIRFEVTNVLYGCGELCSATGRFADALTAWAALDAVLLQRGQPNSVQNDFLRQKDAMRKAREALGPDLVRRAEERGAAMNPATAAEYVLMLTAPDTPSAGQATPGNLSARERELVILVAQGRTDAEIAAQLYISIRTVRSHLDRIRDKTGCRRRADLTRLALSTGLL